jgi:DNA-binding NarL/FixJ family response regulator
VCCPSAAWSLPSRRHPSIPPRRLPDVVLSDIGLPGMSGITGVRLLKERHPKLLLLMLTIYDDDERIFDCDVRGRVRVSLEEDASGPDCSKASRKR